MSLCSLDPILTGFLKRFFGLLADDMYRYSE
uniref:Uncharacterized protein n=1 Tax=Anguilla anguilla TaxID=7936 RepID=A0A0E9UTB9_ANGAN